MLGNMLKAAKGQLRSVIEWKSPDPNHMFYRFSEHGDEIKNASKLVIGPGQGCVFVYEGKVQTVFTDPGLYEIKSANVPFLTTLLKVMQRFESEHKVGLYFFRTAMLTDQKWGTPTAITYEDPKYGFPVKLSCFGNFSCRLTQPGTYFADIAGQSDVVTVDAVRQLIVSRAASLIKDYIAEQKLSYAEIDANLIEIAAGVKNLAAADYLSLGFELTDFRVSGSKFDDDTNRRINRISDMIAEQRASAAVGLNFSQMQQLEALREAARNEGGTAGLGVGMGAGLGLGQMMGQSMAGLAVPAAAAAPLATAVAPVAAAVDDPMAKLTKLKSMLDAGLITAEDFAKKKAEILSSL